MKKCYITTPIYYSSGNVHIGNSYTTIACDVLARYNRAMKRDVFYLTGMDEHGQKIEEAAAREGVTPQAFVDMIANETQTLWKKLKITNDAFIRTTDFAHVTAVQKIYEQLLQQEDIYLGTYSGNYCVSCETFFTKTQLAPEDTCPDCGKPTKLVNEESYFLNLKKYENRLLQHIEENPDFIQPVTRRNEVISFIKSGLEDLCVSRTSFKWGIPVPSNPKHVVYVWIDALSNYITALGYNSSNQELYQKYWLENERIYQIVGKDILRFHAIYWPILLMALDIPLNFKLYVHGWILHGGVKMSKSKGNVIYPLDLAKRYGLDATRYYLSKELPLGNDGNFTYERFIERYNNDLANDLGNLLSRTVAMVEKYFGGIVPNIQAPLSIFDQVVVDEIKKTISDYQTAMESFRIQNALTSAWVLISRANKYIDETAPWTLAKDSENQDKLANVIYHLVEILRIISSLVGPVLVESSPKMLKTLGLTEDDIILEELAYGKKYNNVVVTKSEPLFKRLDLAEELLSIENINQKNLVTNLKSLEPVAKQLINIEDFNKIELMVGEIVASQRHENAEKLLVSQVKIGAEIRQIVSGIAKHYDPQILIGKKVIVVTNLKAVKIRGIESNGMILCAEDGQKLELLEVKDVESGSIVK